MAGASGHGFLAPQPLQHQRQQQPQQAQPQQQPQRSQRARASQPQAPPEQLSLPLTVQNGSQVLSFEIGSSQLGPTLIVAEVLLPCTRPSILCPTQALVFACSLVPGQACFRRGQRCIVAPGLAGCACMCSSTWLSPISAMPRHQLALHTLTHAYCKPETSRERILTRTMCWGADHRQASEHNRAPSGQRPEQPAAGHQPGPVTAWFWSSLTFTGARLPKHAW